MATGPGVNQGKTAFLEEFLPDNRDANEDAVIAAWKAAGNDGTISSSLVSKIRAKLGLTGRRGGTETSASTHKTSQFKSLVKGKKLGRPFGRAKGISQQHNAPETSSRQIAATDHDALDELEGGIDDLIDRLKVLGDRPEVVKALRRARRLLVRSHEG